MRAAKPEGSGRAGCVDAQPAGGPNKSVVSPTGIERSGPQLGLLAKRWGVQLTPLSATDEIGIPLAVDRDEIGCITIPCPRFVDHLRA